jgi:hypothetical protein
MLRTFLVITTMFFLASCGGNDYEDDYYDDPYYDDPYYDNYDSNNDYGAKRSYFHIKDIDNFQYRVGNVKYDCGYLEGVTDSNGLFQYEESSNCIFSFEYNGVTHTLGYLDTDSIPTSNIYIYDLENVTDNTLLSAINDAMDTESLEITRY